MATYKVFVRNLWRIDPNHKRKSPREQWPNGLIPAPDARKTTIRRGLTYEQALDFCRVYNANHKPGRLSRKAEFTAE